MSLHFVIRKLGKRLLDRLYGTLHIRLDNDRKFLHLAGLNLSEDIVERQLCLGLLDELILALGDKGRSEILCLFIRVHGNHDFTGVRHGIQALNLNRRGGLGLLDTHTSVIQHCANLTGASTRCDIVTHMQGSL